MSLRHALLSFAAAGLMVGPALAQAPAPAATSASAPAPTKRDMLIEHRIAELHSRLKITPDEQKPFDDFANVMRSNAADMDSVAAKRVSAAKAGSAVDQMQAYADMAAAHSAQMQRLVPAFSALYAALTPEQKKLADQSFREFAQNTRTARS